MIHLRGRTVWSHHPESSAQALTFTKAASSFVYANTQKLNDNAILHSRTFSSSQILMRKPPEPIRRASGKKEWEEVQKSKSLYNTLKPHLNDTKKMIEILSSKELFELGGLLRYLGIGSPGRLKRNVMVTQIGDKIKEKALFRSLRSGVETATHSVSMPTEATTAAKTTATSTPPPTSMLDSTIAKSILDDLQQSQQHDAEDKYEQTDEDELDEDNDNEEMDDDTSSTTTATQQDGSTMDKQQQSKLSRRQHRQQLRDQRRLKHEKNKMEKPPPTMTQNRTQPLQQKMAEMVPMVDSVSNVLQQRKDKAIERAEIQKRVLQRGEEKKLLKLVMQGAEEIDPIRLQQQNNPKVNFYQSNILQFLENNEMEKALEFLEQMKAESLKPSRQVYNTLIRHYAQKDNLTMTREMYRDLKKHGIDKPNKGSITPMLELLAKQGRVEDITSFATELEDVHTPANMDPALFINSVVIQAHLTRGDVEKALGTFERMKKQNISPDENIYLMLIHGCSKLKASSTVEELWTEMSSLFPPSDKKYSALVEVYLMKEKPDPLKVTELIQTILENHLNLEPRTWYSYLSYLIKQDIKSEDATTLSKQVETKLASQLSRKEARKLHEFVLATKKHIVRNWEGIDLILALNQDVLRQLPQVKAAAMIAGGGRSDVDS